VSGVPDLGELRDCGGELVPFAERGRTREQGVPTIPLGRGDACEEEIRVDPELLGKPRHRVGRRAGLATLDLAHVLLAEAASGEVCLGKPCGRAQRANAAAEVRRGDQ
jgi:hypothetical protein